MKKHIVTALAIVGFTGVVFAQTTNPKYQVAPFGTPPDAQGWVDTISVAADGKGSILAFRRADPPVLIFNREGRFQRGWGNGIFPDKHSIDVDPEGFVWITDRDDQLVYKFSMDGKQLMMLGTKGAAGDNSSQDKFNRPSDVAIAPNGDIFVADGYTNSRVVHFSKDGKFVKIIGGTKGAGPGQFDLPHGVGFDSKGRLLVLDRQNTTKKPRVQIFDRNSGKFVEQWTDLGILQPSGFAVGRDDTVYIGETDGEKITMVKDGKVVDTIPGLKSRVHNLNIDAATGDIYFADSNTPGGIKKVSKK
jgi:DNA-binding beta-propeller fold protein YncE